MLRKALLLASVIALPGTASMALAAKSSTSPEADPHFVKLPAITVPIIDGGRMNGRLSFEIVLDAVDAPAASRLAVALPRLQSASVAAGIEFSRLYASGLATVDAELLARELTTALRHEDPDIGRVLIVRVGAANG